MRPSDMGTGAVMGAGWFRWFMLGQHLPQSSPEAISDLPSARVIRGEDPHALLGLLGLGTSWHTVPGTTIFDLSGLGTEVEDQRDQGETSLESFSNTPSGVCILTGN